MAREKFLFRVPENWRDMFRESDAESVGLAVKALMEWVDTHTLKSVPDDKKAAQLLSVMQTDIIYDERIRADRRTYVAEWRARRQQE